MFIERISNRIRSKIDRLVLPTSARAERNRDLRGGIAAVDPGIDAVVEAHFRWLCRAQDKSLVQDGGVARDFSLKKGWASSYPETTGYIVPTFITGSDYYDDPLLLERACRMLDWLVEIQYPDGPFQGGKIDADIKVPVTFNTGQILLGLAAGAERFDKYVDPMLKAAEWLVRTLDDDGCWRSYPTPFAGPGEKTYETHVSWGLFEAAKVSGDTRYRDAGIKNTRWAISNQLENGWFSDCCLVDPEHPLTHTLGYALRGIVEAFLSSDEREFLDAAKRTADSIVSVCGDDGYLPGRWSRDWTPAVSWVCLTGSVQIAHSLLLLSQHLDEPRYVEAAKALNCYVRRTVKLDGDADTKGAVKGSLPVDGAYGQYEYLNWAAKFSIDSNLLEKSITLP